MVRYYGYYSNVARGKRKETGIDDAIPCILEPEGNSKTFRKNWPRLIQKIYQVDPDLSEMSGVNADHQLHRRPAHRPGHPHASGSLAVQIKTAASLCVPARRQASLWFPHADRPKSVPPHHPNPKPLIPTRILHINTPTPTLTPNTHGMIIFSHNAMTHLKT